MSARLLLSCARRDCEASLTLDVHYTERDETVTQIVENETDGTWGWDIIESGDEVLHCLEHRS